MEIRRMELSDLDKLYEFNKRIYPEKKNDSKKYIDFWLSRNDDAINHIWLVVDDDCIVGQDFMSYMSYYYAGNKYNSYWGFDLIVEEKLRKDTWGAFLMFEVGKAYKKSSFSTGSGDVALELNMKLGFSRIGQLRKYVGIVNLLYIITSFRRRVVDINKYPEYVSFGGVSFKKISKDTLPIYEEPFNRHLLEISRDRDFLYWRYFNNLHNYALYIDDSSGVYFVMRTTIIHGVTAAILVDYRCHVDEEEGFKNILRAAKIITSKLHLSILITGSSHKVFDMILESNRFKSIGRPRPIIGPNKYKDREQDIADRDFCFVTLADSDGETNWI